MVFALRVDLSRAGCFLGVGSLVRDLGAELLPAGISCTWQAGTGSHVSGSGFRSGHREHLLGTERIHRTENEEFDTDRACTQWRTT